MSTDDSAVKHSTFFEEVAAWLTALPIDLKITLDGDAAPVLLKITDSSDRELDLYLRQLAGDTPANVNQSDAARRVVVWEDLWHTKRDIVKSRLLAQLGQSHRIPGRLTQVHRLDRPTTSRFLQENHLQSPTLSKYSYGLFLPARYFRVLPFPEKYEGRHDPEIGLLVAVATFARPRNFLREHGIHRSFELVRFASLAYHTVVGGLDKLLKHFTKTHAPDDLMTYADLEWSSGLGYQKLGFEAQADTLPHTFWVDPSTMIRHEPWRLPAGITLQNAAEKGFIEIKNAGSRKFVKLIHPQIPKS